MWEEVYYEHYEDNCLDAYWEEQKVLPYSVLCKEEKEKRQLCKLLGKYGFKGVGGDPRLKGILINIQFKRWCFYPRPASMSCINGRDYSFEEIQPILNEHR